MKTLLSNNKHRHYLLFTIYYLLFATLLSAASVEARLSSPEVVKGNMAQLQIKAVGNRAAFPDITQIGDAKVLGKSESSNISVQVINSKKSIIRSTTQTLTFAPQHDMTIPSFTVNVDGQQLKTKPLTLKVVTSNAKVPGSKAGANTPFYLSMQADKSRAIVGEPILLTVYFGVRDGVQITQDTEYRPPKFDGFYAKPLKDQMVYRKDGYQIQEIRYLLIPQKEGSHEIGPAVAKVGVPDRSRRDMFGMFFGTRWSQIASNTVKITVDPAPADTDLIGRFTAKARVDHTTTKPNKPVNMTVTIEGEGSLEDFEMPDYEIDGVTVYSDDPVITSHVSGGKLTSVYKKHFVFISDHDFTIPPREFSVLDPQTQKVGTLKIEGFDIKVEGSKAAATSATSGSGSETSPQPIVHTDIQTQPAAPQEKIVTKEVEKTAWWMLAAAFALGGLVMWLLTQLPWKRWFAKERFFAENDALTILYPHMGEDPEVEAMVRKLYAKKRGDKSVQIDKKVLKEMVERYR